MNFELFLTIAINNLQFTSEKKYVQILAIRGD